MSASLEPVVKHDARLDILCCLANGESLTVVQLRAGIGRDERLVLHHIKLLGSSGLVRKEGEAGGGEVLYVARLDEQPSWVQEAVRAHGRAGRVADGH